MHVLSKLEGLLLNENLIWQVHDIKNYAIEEGACCLVQDKELLKRISTEM